MKQEREEGKKFLNFRKKDLRKILGSIGLIPTKCPRFNHSNIIKIENNF
jgi:hypothetical protein